MGAQKRVWVIEDDMARVQVPRGEFGGWYDRGPFVARDRTRMLLLLCFALGPLALLFTRRGVSRFVGAILGLGVVAIWTATVLRWDDVSRWVELGRLPFVPWAGAMLVLSVLWIIVWARTVQTIGTEAGFDPEKLRFLRHPLVAVVFGLVTPGATHLANAGPKRAALAAWNACFTLLAAVFLWKSRWLWHANTATHYWPLGGEMLEWAILGAVGVGFLACLGWLAAVLDGVRCGLEGNRAGWSVRGDLLTLLFLGAVAVAYAASEPTALAWDANETAISQERDGMRRVPLVMAKLAHHLDPSHPAYAAHTATLMEACGDVAGANAMRAVLQSRYQEYQRIFAPNARADSTSAAATAAASLAAPTTAMDSTAATPPAADSTQAPAPHADAPAPSPR